MSPKFCIITPIFDKAIDSALLLIKDLKNQTFQNFQQIFINNGESKIKELLKEVNDERFVYTEYPYEETDSVQKLIANIGKRRNYCLKAFEADRYFFFDADLLITDINFLQEICKIHNKADIIISKMIIEPLGIYPKLPIKKGSIDIGNYSFSKNIAKRHDYPTDFSYTVGCANDWRFYEKIMCESHYFNDLCYAVKNGRSVYENLTYIYSLSLFKRNLKHI